MKVFLSCLVVLFAACDQAAVPTVEQPCQNQPTLADDACVTDLDCGAGNLCSLSTDGLTVCVYPEPVVSPPKAEGVITLVCPGACMVSVVRPVLPGSSLKGFSHLKTDDGIWIDDLSFSGTLQVTVQADDRIWVSEILMEEEIGMDISVGTASVQMKLAEYLFHFSSDTDEILNTADSFNFNEVPEYSKNITIKVIAKY